MRVLLAHNFYQQPGGEDKVFSAEAALLAQNGHEVVRYTQHNDDLKGASLVQLASKTVWNRAIYRSFRAVLQQKKPDLCHFHNTFPLMSPAVFHAARAEGVPVVLTLHNYRLLCPGFTLLRDGAVCHDCTGKSVAWPAVVHGCYRGSRPASATVAMMLGVHRMLGTWSNAIDVYVALTEFARQQFIEGGLPAGKLIVKPNSIEHDPGYSAERGNHALFVGRLSPEKGIATLLAAWKHMDAPLKLRIAGDGPLASEVAQAAREDSRIEWLGAVKAEAVAREMRQAQILVFPSIWYEGLPLTVIEAFATGLPVMASRIGGLPELVEEGHNGMNFEPGNAQDLAKRLVSLNENRVELTEMGRNARRKFEARFTSASNYRLLMEVYRRAMMN